MAKSKSKKKPASRGAAKPLKIDPKALKHLVPDIEALPEDEQAVAIGTMAMDPKRALTTLEKYQEQKTKAAQFDAWARRLRIQLQIDTKHKPVAAPYVGKALVVRTRVDPKTKDRVSKPDIFGVFASHEASGVLKSNALYAVAVACAKGPGRSTSSNPTSNKLTNPLKLLKKRAVVESSGDRVRLSEGCEIVFDAIKWPAPTPRAEYVEPKPT